MAYDENAKILVVGAGGLGGVVGGLLAGGGLDVTLFDRNADHVAAISAAGGLKLVGYGGDRLVQIRAVSDPQDIAHADIVVFLCKAGANRVAAASVAHVFGPATVALTFQNGLGNEDVLAGILGADRVLGGLTAQGGRRESPGVVRNFTELPSYIGEVAAGLSERAIALASLFSKHGLPTHASADIMRVKWQKLFANIAFSASSGLTGLSIAAVGAHPPLHQTALTAIDEAAAVAASEGHFFDQAQRRAKFDELLGSPGASGNTSSMFPDLQARKPSEVDGIYGAVIARAAKAGVAVPTLQTLHALVSGVEATWRE